MKEVKGRMNGIALLLFAILLQLCSAGLEWITLGLGIIGLIVTWMDSQKKK